jgi:hypothetical protein
MNVQTSCSIPRYVTPWIAGLIALLTAGHPATVFTASFAASRGPAISAESSDASLPQWQPGFQLPGLDGRVQALVSWRGRLIAGGDFDFADGQRATGLAAWDGQRWSAIDTTRVGAVTAITVWKDRLVVARFGPDIGGVVALWNGVEWTTLPSFWGVIHALLAQGDSLLAAGYVSSSHDGKPVTPNLLLWTGNSWEIVLPYTSFDGPILALAEYEGGLLIAGEFGSADGNHLGGVARWNGRTVERMGAGLTAGNGSPGPRAIAIVQGKPVLGGMFRLGDHGQTPSLVCFDAGRWVDWGGGFRLVDGLWSDEDGLLACGIGTDGTSVRVARRRDGLWTDLTPGATRLATPSDRLCFAVHEGRVFVGGNLTTSQGTTMSYAAALEQKEWAPLEAERGLGVTGAVTILVPWAGGVIAAGTFQRAGSVAANNIANFDGQEWTPFGKGLTGWVHQVVVTDEGPAAVAGDRIRLWSHGVWSDLTEELGRSSGTPDIGVYRGEVVTTGHFRLPGRADITFIARYHGGHWQPLAEQDWLPTSGFDWSDAPLLFTVDGDLVAYGRRTASNSGATQLLRLTDSGWVELLPAPPRAPFRIVRWGNRYVAACQFEDMSAPPPWDRGSVYAWEGERWTQLGPDMGWVSDVAVYSDSLLLAQPYKPTLRRWNGSAWEPVAGAPSLPGRREAGCEALAVAGGDLWVGGRFSHAGSYPASNIVRYGPASGEAAPLAGLRVLARPNPFSVGTAIRFDVPAPSRTRVTIHGVDGRRLVTLWDGSSGPGVRFIWWDGRDAAGHDLPVGTYWAHVGAASKEGSARIVRIR